MAKERVTGRTNQEGTFVTDQESLERDALENACDGWVKTFESSQEVYFSVQREGGEILYDTIEKTCKQHGGGSRDLPFELLPPTLQDFFRPDETIEPALKIHIWTTPHLEAELTVINQDRTRVFIIAAWNRKRYSGLRKNGISMRTKKDESWTRIADDSNYLLSELIRKLPEVVDLFKTTRAK